MGARTSLVFLTALLLALGAEMFSLTTIGAQDKHAGEPAERVLRAARRLESAPSLRVNMKVTYDAVQDSGSEVEFGSERRVALRRPDRLRVDAQDREGDLAELYFDGKMATLWTPEHRVFASAEVGPGVDGALDALERDLGVPTPLAVLLRSNVAEKLEERMIDAILVGVSVLDDIECDHILLHAADVDAQIWVTRTDAPLIRRVVITYVGEPGRPQFRADLLDWEIGVELPDELFRFEPPAGAERVKFVRGARAEERKGATR